MKIINVVAAVICDSLQEKNFVFATARGYGEFKVILALPGGKIEDGEKKNINRKLITSDAGVCNR